MRELRAGPLKLGNWRTSRRTRWRQWIRIGQGRLWVWKGIRIRRRGTRIWGRSEGQWLFLSHDFLCQILADTTSRRHPRKDRLGSQRMHMQGDGFTVKFDSMCPNRKSRQSQNAGWGEVSSDGGRLWPAAGIGLPGRSRYEGVGSHEGTGVFGLYNSASATLATARAKSGCSLSSRLQVADSPAHATIYFSNRWRSKPAASATTATCRDTRCGDVAVCRSGLQKILA